MEEVISTLCANTLTLLIAVNIIRPVFARDKAKIWSPITTISLVYIYYCLMPYYGGQMEDYAIDEATNKGYLFHTAALLSYICILIGFSKSSPTNFRRWNTLFDEENAGKYGMALFLVGLACYVPFRGLHFTFVQNETHEWMQGGPVYYFITMIDLFSIAAALLLVRLKKNWKQIYYLLPFWIMLVTFIFAGTRWRIVVYTITLLTTYYLFPRPKKVNVLFVGALAVVLFLGFSIMDQTRKYSQGIDMEAASQLEFDDIKGGARENYSVYWFSMLSMRQLHDTGERVYFQPALTALLMPLPRAVFPWKPDAKYLDRMERIIIGSDEGGAAFLNFVESYMSFGWFGVIFMGWLLGWLARKFWDNYRNNPQSVGAVIALGAFSGVCYCIISRGFLASTLTNVIYVVYLPFWLCSLFKRFLTKKKA